MLQLSVLMLQVCVRMQQGSVLTMQLNVVMLQLHMQMIVLPLFNHKHSCSAAHGCCIAHSYGLRRCDFRKSNFT